MSTSTAATVVVSKKGDSLFRLRAPLSVCFAVTNRCNYHCGHCMSASSTTTDWGLDEDGVRCILRTLARGGVCRVDIVGGEPFIRSDLTSILQYGCELDLQLVVTTNGSLLQRRHCEQLADTGVAIQTSIDGPQSINDRLRGAGSFDHSVAALQLLLEYGVDRRICCTLQQCNRHVVAEVSDLAVELQVNKLYFNLVCARGRAAANREGVLPRESEIAAIENDVAEVRAISSEHYDRIDFKKAIRDGVFIDCRGNLFSQRESNSGGSSERVGNVLRDDLEEMWTACSADNIVHLLQFLDHPLLYK
ncbi:MAG: radical SAM protein [Pirellulaceae bacterium]|nr:radical SAM protein [Pirellulaceae bacterium]MDP7017858.1 radical SAM protein [Pirellulaceae bacterium]